MSTGGSERLGALAGAVRQAIDDLAGREAVKRVFEGDHTLWQDDPTEVADRLGWLQSPAEMRGAAADLDRFATDCHADGLRHAVLMGMGGSSLFPEVLARSFPVAAGRLHLHVLDTTDPAAVRRVAATAPPGETLFVAASKSGTTIETTSHLAFFWDRIGRPEHFAVVTDPGSQLADLARERGFRRTFENRADIGGRYSALSYFGLVPAALMGADVEGILDGALGMLGRCGSDVAPAENPAVRLAAVMGAGARAGRDKLTLVLPDDLVTFGLWLEQLVAESTGKHGTGVVPVPEPIGPPEVYGDDRVFVAFGDDPRLALVATEEHPVVVVDADDDRARALGAEVVRWELATALCGVLLGINPFDQPDVAAAKAATSRVLERGLPAIDTVPASDLLGQVRPGDYVSIQAYVDPGDPVVEALARATVALRDQCRVATTFGLGPRFLHSTGQLHKGGPPTGVFLQVVGRDESELPIPGQRYGFSTLKRAQAAGDLETLQARGLRAGRVDVDDLLEESSR
jgi:glucose-6-phosphate isomerase